MDAWGERVASWFGVSFGRTLATWPRRSSFVLAGTLLFIDYLLVAIAVTVDMTLLGRIAMCLGIAPLLALTVAEAGFAIRPTESRLERADAMALLAVGTCTAIALVIIAIGAVTGELFE